MTREFSDELLSAHLDGELSDAERAEVENHLAASEEGRQLYQDLKSLRGELASLPHANVSPDFADRVVRVALAEAEKQNEARGLVSRAPPVERHFWRRWTQRQKLIGAATASAAALAACALLVVLAGGIKDIREPTGPDHPIAVAPVVPEQAITVATLPDQLLAVLTNAAPRNRDAVVLRLKAGKEESIAAALDAALANAGISAAGTNSSSLAALVQESYLRSSPASAEANVIAARDALFIEASLQSLQGVFAELGAAVKDPLQLRSQGKLALMRGQDDDRAEGEGNASLVKPFAQRLDGKQFRLPEKSAETTTAALAAAVLRPEQSVRVLILVEP